jgi:hypothetical protein
MGKFKFASWIPYMPLASLSASSQNRQISSKITNVKIKPVPIDIVQRKGIADI